MTALLTDEEIIQRYTPDEGYGGPYLLSSDDGDAVLYTDHIAAMQRGQEVRAQLREALDRIAELEAMVPKWVPVAQKIALDIQGWLPIEDQKCGDDERQWLMVPPIPLPKGGE